MRLSDTAETVVLEQDVFSSSRQESANTDR